MPKYLKTIDYFTCEFKCGHKADVEDKIANHEKKCYCNPENKACRICNNCSFGNGMLHCKVKGLYFKVEKRKIDSDTKVYDQNMNPMWEIREYPEIYDAMDGVEWTEVDEHNKNRPFPKKNCEEFEKGKKVY
jgi:hypothetical protein